MSQDENKVSGFAPGARPLIFVSLTAPIITIDPGVRYVWGTN